MKISPVLNIKFSRILPQKTVEPISFNSYLKYDSFERKANQKNEALNIVQHDYKMLHDANIEVLNKVFASKIDYGENKGFYLKDILNARTLCQTFGDNPELLKNIIVAGNKDFTWRNDAFEYLEYFRDRQDLLEEVYLKQDEDGNTILSSLIGYTSVSIPAWGSVNQKQYDSLFNKNLVVKDKDVIKKHYLLKNEDGEFIMHRRFSEEFLYGEYVNHILRQFAGDSETKKTLLLATRAGNDLNIAHEAASRNNVSKLVDIIHMLNNEPEILFELLTARGFIENVTPLEIPSYFTLGSYKALKNELSEAFKNEPEKLNQIYKQKVSPDKGDYTLEDYINKHLKR